MKRQEKVYQQLVSIWSNCQQEQLVTRGGSSATEIADVLGITRANASLELNKLVREHRVVKIKSYPVNYLPKTIVEEKSEHLLEEIPDEVTALADLFQQPQSSEPIYSPLNPFDLMIGHNGSLKKAVSQAKAAVHYPPNGLHMLLLGPTGSGKTFFANKIFHYAMYEQLFGEMAPFESFNCADYHNNPQLLLSQLFGYIAGAYTGATTDKSGLVEKADGGILLLDEIHRLTPEGQEMLFYFIDHGRFNRLGETGFNRKANVLIICATTEDPNSALLETFVRRIPMTIQIPALHERSLKERIELTKFLFEKEAQRVKRTFLVDIDVINALITTVVYGNVGQLQSQVQLICAQAFLHSLHDKEAIAIGVQELPEELRGQWSSSSQNIQRSKEVEALLDVTTKIYPSTHSLEEEHDGLNIYEIIENKVSLLEKEGIPEAQIYQYILTDLHLHVKNFVNRQEINYNLLKFMDPTISNLTIELKEIAETELAMRFDRKFLYYVGMHLDAYFRRNKKENLLSQIDISEIKAEHQAEYHTATLFKAKIEQTLGITFPEIEVIYLTMLLVSIETLEEKQKISILVVAHGNSTATSMVHVATELLGNAPISALDMPLNVSPTEMKQNILTRLAEAEGESGVLMLVDMGSLAMMEETLIKESGKQIKTIPNVTTTMVLDVVRKVNYMNLSLNGIYTSVVKDFCSSVQMQLQQGGRGKLIVSICTTGSGTAAKIEQMITDIIEQGTEDTIKIMSVSSLKVKEILPKLLQDYHILAVVGTMNPRIDAPYISLEALIEGEGEKQLRQIIGLPGAKTKKSRQKNIVVKDLCQDTLNMYLVYLNPRLLSDMLLDWTHDLQLKVKRTFSNTLLLKLVVHTAFAFERVVKGNQLVYDEQPSAQLQEVLAAVKETLAPMEQRLLLELTEDEQLFIAEVICGE